MLLPRPLGRGARWLSHALLSSKRFVRGTHREAMPTVVTAPIHPAIRRGAGCFRRRDRQRGAACPNSIETVWIFALMVLINIDVLSRDLFNSPILGVAEIVELSIVGIVFLQISDAVRLGRLTRSDGLYPRILFRQPRIGHVLGAFFDLAGSTSFPHR
jgi:hypothetical protein